MEIAVNHHQPLFGGAVQHPLLQGAVIYPGKGSAWQPVVTSLPPPLTEVPKESIIANTDFTITSGLAKRRLSSKKRKKMETNRLSATDSMLSEGSLSRSPSDSAYGSCQSVSSTTLTPPGLDRTIDLGQHSQLRPTSTSSTLSHPTPLMHTSSSSFHPLLVPPMHSHPPAPTSHTSESSTLRPAVNGPPQPTLVTNQFPNPVMLTQLQQELNYRFLSGGHPHSEQELPPGRKPAALKWCNAHVSVARMIQHHQLETQMQTQKSRVPTSHPQSQDHTPQTEAALTAQQQQQQQLALLQMYGVHPNMSTGVQPGYMTVPYSNVHEMPLVQFAALPQVNPSNNMAMLKPGETVLGLPTHPMQIAASAGAGHMQQFAPGQMAVSNAGGLVMQGGVSWVTPVPMTVGGNCIINPLQAGILAAPWVK